MNVSKLDLKGIVINSAIYLILMPLTGLSMKSQEVLG